MANFETLFILIVVIWIFGKIFRLLKLPVIFGELLGGIIVGPLIFNLVDPENEAIIVLSELGIFFLMLHSGLETNPKELFNASKKSFFVAIFSGIISFFSGFLVALLFHQSIASAIFIGLGLSITAVAIAARLLKDNKLHNTPVASVIMGASIITDIFALAFFSVVLNVLESGTLNFQFLIWMVIKTVLFFSVVLYLGMKLAPYFPKILKNKGFTVTLVTALGLGILAEYIGLHSIIGAFLAGLFIRQEIVEPKIFDKIEDRVYGLSYSFLGPIFFASLAFHLDFTALKSAPLFLVIILLTAIFGKFFSAFFAAKILKISNKDSAIIGMVMNSRGAVELIIASIGIQEGIIGPEVFSILVIMAFVTTLVSIFGIKPIVKFVSSN